MLDACYHFSQVTVRTTAPVLKRTALVVRAQAEPVSRRSALGMVAGGARSASPLIDLHERSTIIQLSRLRGSSADEAEAHLPN